MSTFVETGENGSQLVTVDVPGAIVGRLWKRTSTIGDAGDVISVSGLTAYAHDPRREHVEAVLVVSTLTMEVPQGWSAAVDTMTFDELTASYRPMEAAEIAVMRAEAAVAATETEAASAADTRTSPWRRI